MKFLLLPLMCFLTGCGLSSAPSAPADTEITKTDTLIEIPMAQEMNLQNPEISADADIVKMSTSMGDIYIRFFEDEAPKTVENFVGLAKKGYYDGIIFHRIIDGFMIQGGDPTGTGMGGESLWGGKFKDEFSGKVSNIPYSLSMANSGPGTNGSQFFINTASNTFLDGRHSVFGEVILGRDIVDKIIKVKTGAQDRPVKEVSMETVTVVKYSDIAELLKK